MKKIFVGPTLLSGIGQVVRTYSNLFSGEHIIFGDIPKEPEYDIGFCFIIPVGITIEWSKVYSKLCKKMYYMTVCETETVHESYERLFELSDTIYVPSDFASNVLTRQFPSGKFPVLRHYAPPAPSLPVPPLIEFQPGAYVFYHIGNVIDHRKNISTLINTFIKMKLPNAYLVLKASCNIHIPWSIPNCIIIQGEKTPNEMEALHASCHCYVSCSHSEGAGMGAIEAAVRNKPVIVQEYGAALEYIDTPYVIRCTGLKPVGCDDFLFKKNMEWGNHDWSDLEKHMRSVYTSKCITYPHPKTHALMDDLKHCFLTG